MQFKDLIRKVQSELPEDFSMILTIKDGDLMVEVEQESEDGSSIMGVCVDSDCPVVKVEEHLKFAKEEAGID